MKIEDILKKNNKKITTERIEIFEFISKKHIFDSNDILKNFENIWRASVFRTINLFLEIWVIRKVKTCKNGDSYEIINHKKHSHEHMECVNCSEILSFDSEKIYEEISKKAEKLGFSIEDQIINISGKCKKCKN